MTDKYQKYQARIKKLTKQIDREKLTTAITTVNSLGEPSQVFYEQLIKEPYETEIYITVKLQKNMWSTVVNKYGGIYFPEMSEALDLVADEVLRGEIK